VHCYKPADKRSSYQTVEEYVECAVLMLHYQEAWLEQNRAEIGTKIAEGKL